MKIIAILLCCFMFLSCSNKNNLDGIKQDEEKKEETVNKQIMSLAIDNTAADLQEPADFTQLQDIIENYAKSVIQMASYEWIWDFQIEGNFTGSGNREIIAFYNQYHPITAVNIGAVFCFICDPSSEKIEEIYRINYRTLEFDEEDEIESGLSEAEALGRYIFFRGRKIGCVSDFNGNGIEELYLYRLSGQNSQPHFFEFNGTEFIEIIDLSLPGWPSIAPIKAVDRTEKIITISNIMPRSSLIEEIIENSYIWNSSIQRYEVLSSETKYKQYRWDWNVEKYVEVE